MTFQTLDDAFDYQKQYVERVSIASDFLKKFLKNTKPKFGIVLGSGLGDLALKIENSIVLPYECIPEFPETTIPGHEGKLHIGTIKGVPVVGLQGRKHYYEVADQPFNTGILQTVFPVHVLANLGVPNYFVTNAAGGLNMDYQVGDMMALKSHINLLPSSLLGKAHEFKKLDGTPTWRFQPMNNCYDSDLRELLKNAAKNAGHNIHEGTYLAVTGPTYETDAESVAFRDGYKADAVGMSTTNEVIVARNRGMNCVGFSCITNKIAKDGANPTKHEEVKAILDSKTTRDKLSQTVEKFFELYSEQKH